MTLTGDRGRRRDRLVLWLGHHSLPFLWVYVAVTVVADAWHPGYISAAWGAATVIWFASFLAAARHDARLCGRCMAATPLDPQAAVQRWRPVLRAYHRRRFPVIVMAVFLVTLPAGLLLMQHKHGYAYAGYALNGIAYLAIGLMYTVERRHRLLYPWCPWCHWNDGGDFEASPDVPDPAVSR